MRKISIVDDGTLDTVVECDGEWFRYDSGYRFSFDNDAAFLKAIREEVEDRLEEGVSIAPGETRKSRWIHKQGGTV